MRKEKVPKKVLKIIQAISEMTDTEVTILIRRYASIPELKQHELAAIFHITNERIRQIEERGINRIKKALL